MNNLTKIELIKSRMYEVKQEIEDLKQEYKQLEYSKRQLMIEHNENLYLKQIRGLKQ